jgi:GAF domain-containing protein
LRSQLSVPLFVRDSVLGVINIRARDRRAFTNDEVDFVMVVALQVASAIENSRVLAMTLELKGRSKRARSSSAR